MSKRIVIKFLPVASKTNPSPKPEVVYRGHAKCFDAVWQSCAENLPPELMHRGGRGYIFIGRDSEPAVEQTNPHSPFAKEWEGTDKSGLFHDFLKRELMLYFPLKNEVAVATT